MWQPGTMTLAGIHPARDNPSTGTRQRLRAGSDFAPLSRAVRQAGLLRRSPARTSATIATTFGGAVAIWVAVGLVGNTAWVLLLAPLAALFNTLGGFVMHDAGHHQLSLSNKINDAVGLVFGNLLLGMSYGWWKTKHTRHHANPNHTDKDPDVAGGALVWSFEQAVGRAGFTGWVTRNQARLFFPMLTLEAFSIKVAGVRDLLARPAGRRRRLEWALLAAHYGWYLTLLFAVLSPGLAIGFLVIQHMLCGLHLGAVFAPNHKGMPLLDDHREWTHLQRQVRTSRNVDGGPVIDWLMGGLNHQIEHHLFPAMPRQNLRRARPLIRAHCVEHGLPYVSVPLLTSYREALSYLDEVGRSGDGEAQRR